MENMLLRVLQITWLPVILVATWELVSQNMESTVFPEPSRIIQRGLQVVDLAWIEQNLIPTSLAFFTIYFVGLATGVALGFLIGLTSAGYKYLMPILLFVRKIPSPAKLSILIVALGINSGTHVVSGTIVITFVTTVAVSKLIQKPSPLQKEISLVHGLTSSQMAASVFIPSGIPKILSSSKSSIQISLTVTILGEMLVGGTGLGGLLLTSAELFDFEQVWLGIAFLTSLSLVSHLLFTKFESYVLTTYFGIRT
jgi:ABC-type nitrate/sulfonate/bicarbonate transport system permease component